MKRLLFFMLVAGVVIWGCGALEVRAVHSRCLSAP